VSGPTPSNLGNINNYDFLIRYNPFMTNRAGLALQLEYSLFHQNGTGPTSPVTGTSVNINTNELMFALDFAF